MPELPAPDDEFWERETIKAFHYSMAEWRREPPFVRGQLIAHEIEASLRKGYLDERAHKEAELEAKAKGKPGGERPNAWSAMKGFLYGKP